MIVTFTTKCGLTPATLVILSLISLPPSNLPPKILTLFLQHSKHSRAFDLASLFARNSKKGSHSPVPFFTLSPYSVYIIGTLPDLSQVSFVFIAVFLGMVLVAENHSNTSWTRVSGSDIVGPEAIVRILRRG